MKFSRIFVLLAATALFLTACNQESEPATTAPKQNSNPLLAYVPVDTAYVFANLEPIPENVSAAYVARIRPVLDVLSKQVSQFQQDYGSGEYEGNSMALLASAVLDELGGEVNAESLQNLGISLQAYQAFYAMGVFPVARIELSDAQAFRDAITRIEEKTAVQLPVRDLNGTAYWRLAADGMPVGLYIAILDKQLALSVFPVAAEDRLLASFLGQEMPGQNMASSNTLAIMNSKKGYTGYGSGMVDFSKLAEEYLNPQSATRSYLGPEIANNIPALDENCATEARAMIARAPRMTAGTMKLTENEVAWRYELEMDSMLATGLAALVSDTPLAQDEGQLLSASLAVQIGKLRSYVLEKATAIVASPFQCDKLQQMNLNAQMLVEKLNIPMPPMVNNLMGIRVSVDDIDQDAPLTDSRGLLAVYVDKPEMFVGMASMLIPGFGELGLANQSEPVQIPAEMLQMEDVNVFAALTDNAIGFSIGEQGIKDLAKFMDSEPQDDGTFFSASYDSARQIELQPEWLSNWMPAVDADHPQQEWRSEFNDALKQSTMDMLGYSRLEMRFTGQGLVIDSRMTFK